MDYSKATHELIERMCRNVERKDFVLDKERAEECILKTYDLFNLKRPNKVVWLVDILDKEYGEACDKARSAWWAGSAWWARSAWWAGSAWWARSAWWAGWAGSARSARWAGSAWWAGLARSAGSAWWAGSVRSAGSAGLAGLARSALNYDFDWYVIEHEYCQNPDENKLPNENDFLYLKYSELLMQATEHGLGYRVEWEDTLYLIPTPIVLIDAQNRFHSLDRPAIRWKEGAEFYRIHGVSFDKELWEKVSHSKLPAMDILKLQNIEQRYIALKIYGAQKLLYELDAKLIHETPRNKLYALDTVIPGRTIKLLKYNCPSTQRTYVKFVPDNFTDANEAQAWSFQLTLKEYENIEQET